MSMTADQKLSLRALIALVVGSMIGSGIFATPSAFGRVTGVAGALIAWLVAGVGMLMLAFTFQVLARRRPDLDAGIYAYARAGFGDYAGFASAAGYWIGACLAGTACLVLIKATLGLFFPIFGDGTTPFAILCASALVWAVHFLVLRGGKQATTLNTIATVAKVIPIGLFIVVAIGAFKADLFVLNFWGGEEATFGNVASQARNAMMVTVFLFVGIEGASVYSRYARNRDDVGIATVLGFLGVLCLMILVTMLSYGVLLRADLAVLPSNSMAGVLEAIVGPWGKIFISVGLLISVLGNYLSWSLLAAEVVYSAAQNRTMPAFLAGTNANVAPAAALWMTNALIQAFLLVSWFAEYAFHLALKMTGAMTLIPYLFVAAYGLKLARTGETYRPGERDRGRDRLRAGIATVYAFGMLYAGGPELLMLSALLYAPATILFVIARREQGKPVLSGVEWLPFAVICAVAVGALYGLASGGISI
jgi:arginine:ornithine antiporter/lysine permease